MRRHRRLGACFERRGIDGELGEHAAQPGGVNLILVIAELHHRPLLHATLRRKVGAVSSARGSSSRTGCRVMTYCGVEAPLTLEAFRACLEIRLFGEWRHRPTPAPGHPLDTGAGWLGGGE